MKQTLSVLIPTRDRFDDISKCILNIVNQSCIPETIIVVDSSDKDGLKERLERKIEKAGIEFIYTKSEIKSTAIQRNMGIEKNSKDLILILDDDVLLENTFISEIKKVFQADTESTVGAVVGKIIDRERLGFISSIIRKLFFLSENGKGEVKKSWAANNYLNITQITPVSWASGGCSTFRSIVFKYDQFDENLMGYSYMEDLDYSFRIGKKWKLLFNPDALCIHNHNNSPSTRLKSNEKQKMFMQNFHYFFLKNMSQRFDYKFCHYWSYMGYLIRGLFFERDLGFILGTIQGIILSCLGKNELVNILNKKKRSERMYFF